MDTLAFRIYLRALGPEDYKNTHLWRPDEDIWASVVGSKYFVSMDLQILKQLRSLPNLNMLWLTLKNRRPLCLLDQIENEFK